MPEEITDAQLTAALAKVLEWWLGKQNYLDNLVAFRHGEPQVITAHGPDCGVYVVEVGSVNAEAAYYLWLSRNCVFGRGVDGVTGTVAMKFYLDGDECPVFQLDKLGSEERKQLFDFVFDFLKEAQNDTDKRRKKAVARDRRLLDVCG